MQQVYEGPCQSPNYVGITIGARRDNMCETSKLYNIVTFPRTGNNCCLFASVREALNHTTPNNC